MNEAQRSEIGLVAWPRNRTGTTYALSLLEHRQSSIFSPNSESWPKYAHKKVPQPIHIGAGQET